MQSITELKQSVREYLGACPELHGITVTAEYPDTLRQTPVRQAVIAVGIDSVELLPVGFGGYYGESAAEGTALYGRTAAINLRFDIYTPRAAENACHALYETLCTCLMLSENPFGFSKLWCDAIQYDKPALANRLTVRASLSISLTFADTTLRVTAFDVQKKE